MKNGNKTYPFSNFIPPLGGGVLPYMGYIDKTRDMTMFYLESYTVLCMCRCEGYGFQAVYSRIGYRNQSVWV